MRRWQMAIEPSLDDLLGDEIMIEVMRSAGIDADELRAQLHKAARRLARPERKRGSEGRSR